MRIGQFRESSQSKADKDYSTVNPVFATVDQKTFYEKVEKFWTEENAASAFEAIIAGVVALGSFFSAHLGHPREADIVQHAKEILEDESFQPTVVCHHSGYSCSITELSNSHILRTECPQKAGTLWIRFLDTWDIHGRVC